MMCAKVAEAVRGIAALPRGCDTEFAADLDKTRR
jgi:hypothetical protein